VRFDIDSLEWLDEAARILESGFAGLPDAAGEDDGASLRRVLGEVAGRLHDNYPYFHPLYAGQMLKPPHAVARLAYALAQFINPNNHALDGGRASSAMEKEAVAEIAGMFGWRDHLGHLTGGGTIANLEALWVAGRLRDGEAIVATTEAHYTHRRVCEVLRLPFEEVPADARGRADVERLEARLRRGGVGTVVATLGTTARGAVDALPELLALRERYGFRLHVDAAYGGYFGLAGNLAAPARAAFDRIGAADSIVIDPHKHGLQPYGCGCVLFRDPAVGRIYRHDSPYTYFTSSELHLGEISLECSRAGAGAVALWATQRLLPLVRGGAFAAGLERCREAALALHARLAADERFLVPDAPELDIVLWAPRVGSATQASARSRAIFEAAAARGLHLALARVRTETARAHWPALEDDADTVTCLRSVLMKPEHFEWMDRIWAILDEAASASGGG
jgi:glutamate/tyrosine decarboxylase-like PLP-dependent enzyme